MNSLVRTRNVAIVAVGVAALVWAGVASRGRAVPTTPSAASLSAVAREHLPVPPPPASREEVDREFGIRTGPPVDGPRPAVSAGEALELARGIGAIAGTRGAQGAVQLRDVDTNAFVGDTPKHVGTAWVATFVDTVGQSYGGRGPGPNQTDGCTTTVIVDANTGHAVGNVMQRC